MNNNQKEIKDIVIDEWIWIAFIIISMANIVGDELKKETLQHKNNYNDLAKKIFIITAFISLLIYIYFASKSYQKVKELKFKNKDTQLYEIRLLGNIFVVVGVILIIYFHLNEKEPFNPEIL